MMVNVAQFPSCFVIQVRWKYTCKVVKMAKTPKIDQVENCQNNLIEAKHIKTQKHTILSKRLKTVKTSNTIKASKTIKEVKSAKMQKAAKASTP